MRKVNSFSFQTESFHAGCDKNAAWRKHSSYSASLHLSALILSCCQSQKQSHAKRSAHRHLQQTYKRGLKRWTYLTDWLFSLSSFPMRLCSIHSCSSSKTWRWRRLKGFCSLIFQLDWTCLSGFIMTESLFNHCIVLYSKKKPNSFFNCNLASPLTVSSKHH